MATFFMFGKYTAEALKGISGKRTKDVAKLVKGLGGKIEAMYILLGETDLVIIVDLPGIPEAVKAAVGISKLTGIGICTSPAVPVDKFDKLVG